MIIDFHTHAFPDEIAKKALDKLSYASGDLEAQTKGNVDSLKTEMEKDGVDISGVLSIATQKKQQTKIIITSIKQSYIYIMNFPLF